MAGVNPAARQITFRDFTGKTSLPRLAALLSLCDVMVSNDTGPLHLAAALGRPTIAPYTCTRVALHGPYGQFHRTVSADIACQGSYLRTCPHLNCLPTLPPNRLLPLVVEALSSWARRQP